MRKAFEWPTLFLTGTVSLDVGNSWPVAMQHRWSSSADCRG